MSKEYKHRCGTIDLDLVLSPQTRRWIRQECERDKETPLNWVAGLIVREYMNRTLANTGMLPDLSSDEECE